MNWLERWALTCRLKLRELCEARAARHSPDAFRRALRVVDDNPRRYRDLAQPWQERDFRALDPAWLELAGNASSAQSSKQSAEQQVYRRAFIERPRGHSKTSDMAMQIAWILLHARHPVQGIAAAADRDQADLLWDSTRRLARINPALCGDLEFRRHLILNGTTGSRLEIISSDVQSSWGALPDFVICDELCHWEKPDLWFSLISSAAKRPRCVLVVLTNAGVGRGWQWDVREAARTDSRWHFSSLAGPSAPWITAEQLDEQRQLLPPPVFDRLWNNAWQHSDGEFVTLAEAEACRDPQLRRAEWGEPGQQYVAAVDYAEKHDFTVGVVIHPANGRIVVDRLDVAVPTPDQPVKVAWVENWMREVAARFPGVSFVLDEYQLLGTIQKLEAELNVRRFEFRSGRGNHALALNLRQRIVHRELAWYPGCGDVSNGTGRDDLETELASLLLRQSSTGVCRIDHRRDGTHHDDRAFALGAACLQLANAPRQDWLEITPPNPDGGFHWM